ncbi:unnamed protein product, partial [Tenebrio molitor]
DEYPIVVDSFGAVLSGVDEYKFYLVTQSFRRYQFRLQGLQLDRVER